MGYKIQNESAQALRLIQNVQHCSSKIPEGTLSACQNTLSDHKKLPTWQQKDNFITKRIETLETI